MTYRCHLSFGIMGARGDCYEKGRIDETDTGGEA